MLFNEWLLLCYKANDWLFLCYKANEWLLLCYKANDRLLLCYIANDWLLLCYRANGDMKHDASDDESEEENPEGDYTVYECPGLAPVSSF